MTLFKKFDVGTDQLEVMAEKAAEAQREADRTMAQWNVHRTLANSCDEAKADLNKGSRKSHRWLRPRQRPWALFHPAQGTAWKTNT